jgi:hypothetical protein
LLTLGYNSCGCLGPTLDAKVPWHVFWPAQAVYSGLAWTRKSSSLADGRQCDPGETSADFKRGERRWPQLERFGEGHLCFFEEILIYLFQDKGFFDDNAAVMFDHESCEFGAVNED